MVKSAKKNDIIRQIRDEMILSDGAMGTMLHNRGISFDQCFDELNVTQPALVGEIHRAYIDAGSSMIQTNTFGSNRYKLDRHGLSDKLESLNKAGVDIAHKVVAGSFKKILIAGDIGPLGVRLAPFGRVQPEQAREVFQEQISALINAGVDLLILETFSDVYEIQEALKAVLLVDPEMPVVASMTFTRDDLTLLGDTPTKVAHSLHQFGADVIGVNCSGGPAQILRILKLMKQAEPDALLSVMPNAGWPEQVGGRIMYPAAPEYFGDYAAMFRNQGANIVGGCCGTTPDHISYMRQALDTQPVSIELVLTIVSEQDNLQGMKEQPSQFAQKLARGDFAIAVEMDPPRGLTTQNFWLAPAC